MALVGRRRGYVRVQWHQAPDNKQFRHGVTGPQSADLQLKIGARRCCASQIPLPHPGGVDFFAVLDPGGQQDPNGGTARNVSDDFDAYTNRTLSVSGGAVSYAGNHNLDGNKIRLMPNADTPNPDGVYISRSARWLTAIRSRPRAPSTTRSRSKEREARPAARLLITKDANGTYDNTYNMPHQEGTSTRRSSSTSAGNAKFDYDVDS
jgi:hypothetical protein